MIADQTMYGIKRFLIRVPINFQLTVACCLPVATEMKKPDTNRNDGMAKMINCSTNLSAKYHPLSIWLKLGTLTGRYRSVHQNIATNPQAEAWLSTTAMIAIPFSNNNRRTIRGSKTQSALFCSIARFCNSRRLIFPVEVRGNWVRTSIFTGKA